MDQIGNEIYLFPHNNTRSGEIHLQNQDVIMIWAKATNAEFEYKWLLLVNPMHV